MGIRLGAAMGRQRIVEPVAGVRFIFRAWKYREIKALQATASRRVRQDWAEMAVEAEEAARDDGGVPAERALEAWDRIHGLIEEVTLDLMVERFCEGWEGVEDLDGALHPFSAEAWRRLRDAYPALADRLAARLMNPIREVEAEGNA